MEIHGPFWAWSQWGFWHVRGHLKKGITMELTKRLTRIASFVDEGMKVADIGTDHGYVPIYLVKKGGAGRLSQWM